MRSRLARCCVVLGGLSVFLVGYAREGWSLPASGALIFSGPTPAQNGTVTTGTISVQVDAACTVNPTSLAVALNGNVLPQSNFLPFGACNAGRMLSQIAVVNVTLPNGTISGGPTSLIAGGSGNFSGTGNGNSLSWNFDGGAEPRVGSPASATFAAAGSFTVRLQARQSQSLTASATDNGNLVVASRPFAAADPTPDTRVVSVSMPPDVDFRNYESAQTHPLAMSAAEDRLYALNTPENRLAIFNVAGDGSLSLAGDVPVGVDPVSLAVRPGSNEVWVVNHLSDSVSIVDPDTRKLLATIAVGDEPTDIVFASGRAFVTLAGNQDRVKVYNASTRAEVANLSLFGDDPRALATNAAGTEVYAVVLESGNGTTVLFEDLVSGAGGLPNPSPPRDSSLPGGATGWPDASLIVKFNPANGQWQDQGGGNWSTFVDFTLPDNDLFIIDADATTPSVTGQVSRIGTILYDVAARPGSSELWVANTDARNVVRFEPNLRGHLVQTRISKVTTGGSITQVDLNSHINYGVTPGSGSEIAQSLSQPGDGVFNSAGTTFYLTAFGSGKVGVLNSAGAVTARINVGNGPSGVALNEADARLYVLNRFDNTISTVNTSTNTQLSTIGLAGPSQFDPSPDVVKAGRKFLYDARITSGHGDIACATCHVFSNFDNLAWDLGDPTGEFVEFADASWVTFAPLGPSTAGFDPMKGPMTTQTLRGLLNMEPFHWRGDRQNFQHFNHAFVGLMGMNGNCRNRVSGVGSETPCNENSDCSSGETCLGLSTGDMNAYTAFIETVNFPPNPFRNLDNSMPNPMLVPNQNGSSTPVNGNPNNGATIFSNAATPLDAGVFQCGLCHALPTGTSNNLFNGNAEGEAQDFKIPHLRNMYEKVGFNVIRPGLQSGDANIINTASAMKKGVGFIHDGAVSLTEFLAAGVFNSTSQQERDLFAFMLAFPTESVPAIGRQQTVDNSNKNDGAVTTVINTLIAQAETAQCDLIVKGVVGGVAKGFLYNTGTNAFDPDSLTETALVEADLRNAVGAGDVITYMGVPPGAGRRLALDRDRDTWLDRSELALGKDPANPNSNPWSYQP